VRRNSDPGRPLNDPSRATLRQMLFRSPDASRAGLLNNAELVVWQSSRRFVAAAVIASIALLLRLAHIVLGPVWPILTFVPIYLAIIAMMTVVIERRRHVTRATLVLLAVIDVMAIFLTIGFVTAPAFYSRALILSFLALQFTQLFFNRTPAIAVVVASVLAYAALLFGAWEQGIGVGWSEQAWLLVIYLIVSLHGIALQASANHRLAMLVDLFSGAQRGDFSRTFREDVDREPDGITLLGRAYNQLRSELSTLVLTDALTGCFNRRGLEQVMTHAIGTANRYGGELAMLAIDIDHFKAINDSFGHLAGDAVLRELAQRLVHCSRAGDFVARVGGEEFVMLLPGADGETAGVVAERVRATVAATGFRTARGREKVTVSIGIAAEQVTDGHIAGSLRARADEALYLAKRLGRDRVVMWAPGIRSNATPTYTSIEPLLFKNQF